jgi:hypothetical protein
MQVELDIHRDVVVRIPFDLDVSELQLEKGTAHSSLSHELNWLTQNATEEELPRILTSALVLHQVRKFPIADCLHTAIIWERG